MYFNSSESIVSIIARPKLTGGGEHWGVRFNNYVAHNTDDNGPHIVSLEEFAAGRPVREIRRVPPSEHYATMQRIQQEVAYPTKYHLLENNCEIFANRVTGYIPVSPQVKGWGIVLGLAALTVLAANAG
jgi:hypothetical protein